MTTESQEPLEVVVGIATKDNAATIAQTLESLRAQTRMPDRLIIVDDSSDDTREIITSYADDGWSIDILDQPREGVGVGAARAAIHAEFDGDILCCLDTEQVVDDDWVMKHIQIHQSHPEVGIVSKANGQRPSGRVTSALGSDFFTQGNCSLKSGALDCVDGWDRWFHRGEDWDMRIRLWCAGVTAFATPAVRGRGIGTAGTTFWFRTKVRHGPSSLRFIRKYGRWYVRFNPKQLLGDLLGVANIGALALLPLLAWVHMVLLLSVGVVLHVSPVVFAYMRQVWPSARWWMTVRDLRAAPILYANGLAFLRELTHIRTEREWNLGGFDRQVG